MELLIGKDAGSFPAYFKESASGDARPAVILIHEIWGLNANIRSIADRIASEGFDVLAPDLMHGSGFEAKIGPQIQMEMADPSKRNEAQKKLRAMFAPAHSPVFGKKTIARLGKCVRFLGKGREIAVVGFCFGGTYSFALACEAPLAAAVVFYGRPPEPLSRVKGISCPVIAFYGERDTGLTEGLPALEAEMRKRGKEFAQKTYKGCGHAFFNDTNKAAYNKAAAQDSWKTMIAFLKGRMGVSPGHQTS